MRVFAEHIEQMIEESGLDVYEVLTTKRVAERVSRCAVRALDALAVTLLAYEAGKTVEDACTTLF